jgi:hypothetical protein
MASQIKEFDERGLALLDQERKADGEDSTFAKLVRRERVS